MRANRFLMLLAALFALLAATAPSRLDNSTGSFREECTDQISHWGSTLLFAKHGFDVYRHSAMQLCLPMNAEASGLYRAEALPRMDYACRVSDEPGARPVLINYPERVQNYPPGKFLYSAPEAILYSNFGATFGFLKKFTLLKYLLVSHLAFALFVLLLLPRGRGTVELALLLILGPLFYEELVFWATYGIYDAVSVGALFLSLYCLGTRRPARAIAWYAAASFLHFRALWCLPIPIAATARLPLFLKRSPIQRVSLLLAFGFFCVSAYSLILALPDISHYPVRNPVALARLLMDLPQALAFGLPLVALLGLVAFQRAWLVFWLVLWQAFMLVRTPDVRPWHGLFYLPIIAATLLPKHRNYAVTGGVLVFYLALNHIVFAHAPWPMSGEFLGYTFGIGK